MDHLYYQSDIANSVILLSPILLAVIVYIMFTGDNKKTEQTRVFGGDILCTPDGLVNARYLSIDEKRYIAGDRIDYDTLKGVKGTITTLKINDTELVNMLVSGHHVIATNSKQRR